MGESVLEDANCTQVVIEVLDQLNITVNDTSFIQDLNVSNVNTKVPEVPDCQHYDPSNLLKCLENDDDDEFGTTDIFSQWSTEGDPWDDYDKDDVPVDEVEDETEEQEDDLAQYCGKTIMAK